VGEEETTTNVCTSHSGCRKIRTIKLIDGMEGSFKWSWWGIND